MHKIKAMLGTVVVAAGLSLASAVPAHADQPTVVFDYALHFGIGSTLSDSTSFSTLNVAAKWRQSSAEGICSETGGAYQSGVGYLDQWSSIRTFDAFPERADSQVEMRVSPTDCSGDSVDYGYDSYSWQLTQESAGSYSNGWGTSSCNCWSGGTVRRSTGAGQSMTYTRCTYNGFGLVTDKAPGRGSATVYVDGVKKGTLNDAASVVVNRVVGFVYYGAPYPACHTVQVVVNSGRVDIDAFVTS